MARPKKITTNNELYFYKNRYAIALYDKEDWCYGVFDNLSEVSVVFKIPYKKLKCSLNKALKRNYLWLGYRVYLIDMLEELKENNCGEKI